MEDKRYVAMNVRSGPFRLLREIRCMWWLEHERPQCQLTSHLPMTPFLIAANRSHRCRLRSASHLDHSRSIILHPLTVLMDPVARKFPALFVGRFTMISPMSVHYPLPLCPHRYRILTGGAFFHRSVPSEVQESSRSSRFARRKSTATS